MNAKALACAAADRLAVARPLVVHVVYRFDVGGLENGVVNLINHMSANAYRHAVVALTDITEFSRRIERPDVELIALHKPPGHAVRLYPQLYRLFRALRPQIVHSRNLAALETVIPAWAAGVPVRIHGEHGRDMADLDGKRYRRLRRLYRPFVSHYFALSPDLAEYLEHGVHVSRKSISQVYNGVDSERFAPAPNGGRSAIEGCPFTAPEHWIVGTVGRMDAVKDQPTLARAFVRALAMAPELRPHLRLVMVGEGPLRRRSLDVLDAAGVGELAWCPGERHDIPDVMRGLDCFVLPSLAEGVSNTILEAMASALPVIATRVGANANLVRDGLTGAIVEPADAEAIAAHLVRLASNPEIGEALGRAGLADAIKRFSLQAMVASYQRRYDLELAAAGARH